MPGLPHSLRFRPDGKAVAVSFLDEATVTVIDLATGEVLANDRFPKPRGIDWHRDNHRLAVAGEGGITIWNTHEVAGKMVIAVAPKATIERVAWSHHPELLASSGLQQPVAIHDGNIGQTLVFANGDVKDLRFWNREMRDIGGMEIANGRFVAFTSDSLLLVADTVRRHACELAGDPPLLHLEPPEILDPQGGWQCASTTADGRWLAVARRDQATMSIWKTRAAGAKSAFTPGSTRPRSAREAGGWPPLHSAAPESKSGPPPAESWRRSFPPTGGAGYRSATMVPGWRWRPAAATISTAPVVEEVAFESPPTSKSTIKPAQ